MATRKRTIQPSIWQDPDFGTLSPFAKLVFIGLITQADDEGRLLGHPAMIASILFPYQPQLEQVMEALLELTHGMKNVFFYEIDGQYYIQLKNWFKHQVLREDRMQKSLIPAPKRQVVDSWQADDGQMTAEVSKRSKEVSKCDGDFKINSGELTAISSPLEKLRKQLIEKGILKENKLL